MTTEQYISAVNPRPLTVEEKAEMIQSWIKQDPSLRNMEWNHEKSLTHWLKWMAMIALGIFILHEGHLVLGQWDRDTKQRANHADASGEDMTE